VRLGVWSHAEGQIIPATSFVFVPTQITTHNQSTMIHGHGRPPKEQGRKDSESIIHKRDANHSLSTNSILSPLLPYPLSPHLSLLGPALLYSTHSPNCQQPAESSLYLSPLLPPYTELSRASPPFPKHNNSFHRRTQSVPFNALTAGCPAHAQRDRAPLSSLSLSLSLSL
jgi:hypothetical protein